MTYIICIAIGFAAGVYREKISEKARELYIKIKERR
jgi:hypothetical protein